MSAYIDSDILIRPPGHGVDIHDRILAVTALETGGTVYTLNRKHYRMPELAVTKAR